MPRSQPQWSAELVRNGRVQPPLVQYLQDLGRDVAALDVTVTATAAAVASTPTTATVSIYGTDGVQVYGDSASGFSIRADFAPFMARQTVGF